MSKILFLMALTIGFTAQAKPTPPQDYVMDCVGQNNHRATMIINTNGLVQSSRKQKVCSEGTENPKSCFDIKVDTEVNVAHLDLPFAPENLGGLGFLLERDVAEDAQIEDWTHFHGFTKYPTNLRNKYIQATVEYGDFSSHDHYIVTIIIYTSDHNVSYETLNCQLRK